jgi:hypothetical protein
MFLMDECEVMASGRERSPTIITQAGAIIVPPKNRNGVVPFALATAGVFDASDLVSWALTAVTASVNTNAIASLDRTDFSSCARQRYHWISVSSARKRRQDVRRGQESAMGHKPSL